MKLSGGGEGDEVEGLVAEKATGAGDEAEERVAMDDSIESRKGARSGGSDGLDAGAGELFAELLPALAVE